VLVYSSIYEKKNTQLNQKAAARLDEMLAPDMEVYQCALELHNSQVQEHGPGVHAQALARFQSTQFQGFSFFFFTSLPVEKVQSTVACLFF
jgi:hypothetical protein